MQKDKSKSSLAVQKVVDSLSNLWPRRELIKVKQPTCWSLFKYIGRPSYGITVEQKEYFNKQHKDAIIFSIASVSLDGEVDNIGTICFLCFPMSGDWSTIKEFYYKF